MITVHVHNGPNPTLLGQREPTVHGSVALAEIERLVCDRPGARDASIIVCQSNHDGQPVERTRESGAQRAGVDADASGGPSVARRDAAAGSGAATVEANPSNVQIRGGFRHRSLIAPVPVGRTCGFGPTSDPLGLEAVRRAPVEWAQKTKPSQH